VTGLDLTVECITHRFTPNSKEVLEGWYPRGKLEMDPELRSRKRGKFGAVKYVYPVELMRELRCWFADALISASPRPHPVLDLTRDPRRPPLRDVAVVLGGGTWTEPRARSRWAVRRAGG
jgi:hypothetical protein